MATNSDHPKEEQEQTTKPALEQEAHKEGSTREDVVKNIRRGAQAEASSQQQPLNNAPDNQSGHAAKTSGRKPGEVSPELGQDSGSDWQESQQMGKTGLGGVQNPQTNP